MTDMILNGTMTIDETQMVISAIERMCGSRIRDLAAVRKFILKEKNTAFYIDRSLNSYMKPDICCPYLWLDTGYTDMSGNAIMISLLQGPDGYKGHLVGTLTALADNAIGYLKLNKRKMQSRVSTLKSKYLAKAAERETPHIVDQDAYILGDRNAEPEMTEMAAKIMALGVTFEQVPEAAAETEAEAITAEPEADEKVEVLADRRRDFTAFEEEITIDILLDVMEQMQATIDELYGRVEELSDHSSKQEEQMNGMAGQIEEYRRALVRMRSFKESEMAAEEEAGRAKAEVENIRRGHQLLGSHGQILVIGGDSLGAHIMQGIAKDYGFEKSDFEFISYDKAKNSMDRIRRDGRYRAIIFGACPHSTASNAGYNSALDKFLSVEGMPFTVDARCKNGSLKVTKQSFREALESICTALRGPEAA